MKSFKVLSVTGKQLLPYKEQIRQLTSEFSDSVDINRDFETKYEQMLKAKQLHTVLVFDGEVCVAMYQMTLKVTTMSFNAYIDSVVVSKKLRGQGIGQFLVDDMKKRAKEYGTESIELTSSKSIAQQLYKKAGFETSTTAFRFKF